MALIRGQCLKKDADYFKANKLQEFVTIESKNKKNIISPLVNQETRKLYSEKKIQYFWQQKNLNKTLVELINGKYL